MRVVLVGADFEENLGIGMVACVPAEDVPRALEALVEHGEQAFLIGEVVPRTGAPVEFV